MKFQFQVMTGYAYGSQQPAVILHATDMPDLPTKLTANLASLIAHMPPSEVEHASNHGDAGLNDDDTLTRLVQALDYITLDCGDLRLTPVLWSKNGSAFQCFFPTLSPQLAVWVFQVLVQNLENRDDPMSEETQDEFLKQIKKKSRHLLPSGSNARSLIQSAAERKMPFHVLDNRHLIFGYGAGARLMSSSMTDRESAIGVRLARSKALTNRFLGMSGFPVTKQVTVNDIDDIKRFTKHNGFPVVLKPADSEQGQGIHTYITTDEEAEATLKTLQKSYRNIVLERHYHGDGYRITVLDDEAVWVRKLSPAHVIGDGTSTVETLVSKENENPARSAVGSILKKLVIDDTMTSLVRKQGYTLDAVPEAGTRIVLSPTSNVSRGGTSEDFGDRLHPENRKLCIDVTNSMHLECTGVDMISEDLSRPWYENGAVICEINAQPQIGLLGRIDVHDMLIDRLNVRQIPITLEILGDASEDKTPLFDRSKDRLHLKISARRILLMGCPVQYFDDVIYAPDVAEADRKRVAAILQSVPIEDRAA
ncbi:MAG: hypothetical protein HRU30_08020 [Rhodobacteraceae bacterium]|nr:hypothetical protein [Paracoccaceae bacterium]